jgi:hypothetical protein
MTATGAGAAAAVDRVGEDIAPLFHVYSILVELS